MLWYYITEGEPAEHQVDFAVAMQRMRDLRAHISPADSAKRFKDLGVDVYFGQAAFDSSSHVEVIQTDGNSCKLEFKKAVIATGARASAPPIEGLEQVDYLTNETLFSLTELPQKLAVIGSGPIGCEMAQAFARFGSQVTLLERGVRILPRESPKASAAVAKQFERDGIHQVLNAADLRVSRTANGQIEINVTQNEVKESVQVDQVLVAVGRAPNIDGLNLDAVNVQNDRDGIAVNDFLQTTNSNIYAAGDICSKFKFTHSADFMARIVIQNTLFALGPLGRRKFSDLIIPWATYTSPEVAHVGLYEHEAKNSGIEFDVYRQDFSHLDRAILEGQEAGFAEILTVKGSDKILGATIVAEHAGDLISQITLAMKERIGLGKIASVIHPYPTQAEAIRKLGDQFNRTKLTSFNKTVLGILRTLNVGK
ncbi:MAG: mercuric reductase [Planctomycetota bacterium]